MDKLTDTQLLDLIEKHCFEVAYQSATGLITAPYWRVWIDGNDTPHRALTFRDALHLAHTDVVTKILSPKI